MASDSVTSWQIDGETMVISSGNVWMWELDCEESWVLRNWCFWTVVLEKTLESTLVCKEIQLVNPKGNQSWIFIGRTDAEAETPILWPLDAKYWLIGKDPDAGKDWRQEKVMTEDEMVGCITDSMDMRLSKLQELVMDREACCSPWGHKELDRTEWLNWTDLEVTWPSYSPAQFCFLAIRGVIWYTLR